MIVVISRSKKLKKWSSLKKFCDAPCKWKATKFKHLKNSYVEWYPSVFQPSRKLQTAMTDSQQETDFQNAEKLGGPWNMFFFFGFGK